MTRNSASLVIARPKPHGSRFISEGRKKAGRLLDDPARQAALSAAALTAVADYDWSVVARSVFSVYETVVLGSTQVAVTAPGGEFP